MFNNIQLLIVYDRARAPNVSMNIHNLQQLDKAEFLNDNEPNSNGFVSTFATAI